MNSGAADDRVWVETRSRAGILARTLPDATADQRLSLAEAARELGVDRSTVFRWRARFETERRLSALHEFVNSRGCGNHAFAASATAATTLANRQAAYQTPGCPQGDDAARGRRGGQGR